MIRTRAAGSLRCVFQGCRPAWILQNPLFRGYAALESYLPSQRISIALAVTFKASSFDSEGNYSNYWSSKLYAQIGRVLAPQDPPLVPKGV